MAMALVGALVFGVSIVSAVAQSVGAPKWIAVGLESVRAAVVGLMWRDLALSSVLNVASVGVQAVASAPPLVEASASAYFTASVGVVLGVSVVP